MKRFIVIFILLIIMVGCKTTQPKRQIETPEGPDVIPGLVFGLISDRVITGNLPCEDVCELAAWFRTWGSQQQLSTFCGMSQVVNCECEACESEG